MKFSRNVRSTIFFAAAVEVTPFVISTMSLVVEGMHPGAGIFMFLHLPSSLILLAFEPVLKYFVVELISYLIVVILQIGLFAALFYYPVKFWNRNENV